MVCASNQVCYDGEALKLEKLPERDPESFGNFFKRAEPGVQRFAGFKALVIAVVKPASFRHFFLCELKLLAETAQAACELNSEVVQSLVEI